ncbi:hypothetical protein JB92DRAFT_1728498 [Gautieria morchelliformis]|nr:hypothetical protein JB92DRAFT_1728498 [Gautieria morchelliformis]
MGAGDVSWWWVFMLWRPMKMARLSSMLVLREVAFLCESLMIFMLISSLFDIRSPTTSPWPSNCQGNNPIRGIERGLVIEPITQSSPGQVQ